MHFALNIKPSTLPPRKGVLDTFCEVIGFFPKAFFQRINVNPKFSSFFVFDPEVFDCNNNNYLIILVD